MHYCNPHNFAKSTKTKICVTSFFFFLNSGCPPSQTFSVRISFQVYSVHSKKLPFELISNNNIHEISYKYEKAFFFSKMITCKKSRYTSYFRYSDNPFHLINQYLHLKVDTFKSIYEGFTTMFEIYINELTIITRGTPKKNIDE